MLTSPKGQTAPFVFGSIGNGPKMLGTSWHGHDVPWVKA
jgi:hypothetical protein